ncbi:MAG: TrmH family RNA methyltransferase [Acidimicrobiales bacterium]
MSARRLTIAGQNGGVATIVPIDDPTDVRVRDFAGLNDPDLRRRLERPGGDGEGYFVVEGPLVVRRLVQSDYRVRALLVTDRGLRSLREALAPIDAPVYVAPQAVVDAVGGFNFHRGALASADRRPLPDLTRLAGATDLAVLIEGVNDHENLGALFRNAAAFGAGAVVLDPTTADPLYRRSTRVSMGHVLGLPYTRAQAWPGAIADLRALGFEVLALTPATDADDVRSVEVGGRQAVLVGAEGPGLSPPALACADRRVRVTMADGVDSLNVATAAAVVLHHLASPR